jgi:hypothetical protein
MIHSQNARHKMAATAHEIVRIIAR